MKTHKTIFCTLNFSILLFFSIPNFSQIDIDFEREITFPFSTECQAPDCESVKGLASGWGVMSPAVVVSGKDQYTFAWYGCDSKVNDRWRVQCIELTKNGESITETLHTQKLAANTVFPSGTRPEDINQSYQPPLLFKHGSKLIVVHWAYMSSRRTNIIFAHSVDLRLPAPLEWRYESSHILVDGSALNYLGGALKGDQIFIAGYRSGGGAQYNRAELLNLQYANGMWQFSGPLPIAVYDGQPGFQPTYTHVIIKDNDEIRILGSFQDGRTHNSYMDCVTGHRIHNIAEWKGRWGQAFPFEAVWSDRVKYDPCFVSGNQQFRFAYDFLCAGCGDGNPNNDDIYAVYQQRDVISLCPLKSEVRYPVRKNGQIVQNDLSDKFGDEQIKNSMYFLSMTQLSSSQFVFATTVDRDIYFQVSSDLTNFLDKPIIKKTTFNNDFDIGVGNQIKLGQPNKNGSDRLIPKLHFYHGGTVYFRDDDDRVINNQHRYKFYRASVRG